MKSSRWTLIDVVAILQTATLPVMLAVPAYLSANQTVERQGMTLGWMGRMGLIAASMVLGVVFAALAWAILIALTGLVTMLDRFARHARRRR